MLVAVGRGRVTLGVKVGANVGVGGMGVSVFVAVGTGVLVKVAVGLGVTEGVLVAVFVGTAVVVSVAFWVCVAEAVGEATTVIVAVGVNNGSNQRSAAKPAATSPIDPNKQSTIITPTQPIDRERRGAAAVFASIDSPAIGRGVWERDEAEDGGGVNGGGSGVIGREDRGGSWISIGASVLACVNACAKEAAESNRSSGSFAIALVIT